ncbi:MAG: hypothetical protein DGJ47_000234 [Rickettsiaceae bacterium]
MATKRDLIDKIEKRFDFLNQEDAALAVNCAIEEMERALLNGGRVEIRGFGSLSVRQRKYCGKDSYYNTVYYRMSKNIQHRINK